MAIYKLAINICLVLTSGVRESGKKESGGGPIALKEVWLPLKGVGAHGGRAWQILLATYRMSLDSRMRIQHESLTWLATHPSGPAWR